jgi:hypothetical protein
MKCAIDEKGLGYGVSTLRNNVIEIIAIIILYDLRVGACSKLKHALTKQLLFFRATYGI